MAIEDERPDGEGGDRQDQHDENTEANDEGQQVADDGGQHHAHHQADHHALTDKEPGRPAGGQSEAEHDDREDER